MVHRCDYGHVHGPDVDSGGERYIRLDCGRLACDNCGERRVRKLRKRVSQLAEENRLTRFLTLTLDPARLPAGENSVDYLRACFAKFRVYLGRRFQGAITYLAVVELHKSGVAHLHVLVGRFIPQDWISVSWAAVGGGIIVDIRFVDVHRIGAYVSKYLTKQVLLSIPARKKRISTSRDIRISEKRERTGFSWGMDPIDVMWQVVQTPGSRLFNHEFDGLGIKAFVIGCCV
jgi:hypothetical protein